MARNDVRILIDTNILISAILFPSKNVAQFLEEEEIFL